MYIRLKGMIQIPKLISDEEYFALPANRRCFYYPVEDGGETVAFDKSSDFKGEILKRKRTKEELTAEYEEALEEYENSSANLNRIVNQHYTD